MPLARAQALGFKENSPGIPSDGVNITRLTGTFGDLSTQSFYPPHHLTMGEGGAVNVVREMRLKVLVESFRDWGRDCWCASGKDNTCNKRFGWQLGELPEGYDHKYIYSHLGYNLKPLDPQAAIGRQQLKKLPGFIQARIDNWNTLRAGLADLEEFFTFHLPTHATGWTPQGFTWDASGHRTECSWFGFMMLVKPTAPFNRRDFVRALDAAKIGNRMLFGGNLVRQPAFVTLRAQQPNGQHVPRRCGDLPGADRIMNEAAFVGTYPGLTPEMLGYMIETIRAFVKAPLTIVRHAHVIQLKVLTTDLAGSLFFSPEVFEDHRGSFVKTYHEGAFREAGIPFAPREEFFSVSHEGVLRGMHFQLPPAAHDKLVYCPVGKVLDVVVDIAEKPPRLIGRSIVRELSAANRELLYIPVGFAHGFLSLADDTDDGLPNQHGAFAHRGRRHFVELSFGFEWPLGKKTPIVSKRRDKGFPALR